MQLCFFMYTLVVLFKCLNSIKYLRIHQISNNFVGKTKMNIVEMKHSIKRNPTSGF